VDGDASIQRGAFFAAAPWRGVQATPSPEEGAVLGGRSCSSVGYSLRKRGETKGRFPFETRGLVIGDEWLTFFILY
jgi:hypothetical protein